MAAHWMSPTSQQFAPGEELRAVLMPITAMFVASRVVLLLVAWIVATGIGTAPNFDGTLAPLLCRWDCAWYLEIAQRGYSMLEGAKEPGATDFAFYPLFPLLVRAASTLFAGDALHAAIAVASLCSVAALLYVHLYVRELGFDRNTGLLTAGMLCIFPQSIVFSAPFSEGIYLLLLAAALYHLRREQYLASGIAAALLTATRANGIFFVIFVIAWLLRRHGLKALVTPWRAPERFAPVMLAPLGFFVFLGYCFVATGDAFAHPSTEFYGWQWHFVPPWENLPVMLRMGGVPMLAAAISLVVAACSLLLLRQRLYEEFVLCAALILLIWSGQGAVSLFRYWLVLFPVWIGAARALASKPLAAAAVLALLATINVAMTCAWALGKAIAL
jgi:hypothetical protein